MKHAKSYHHKVTFTKWLENNSHYIKYSSRSKAHRIWSSLLYTDNLNELFKCMYSDSIQQLISQESILISKITQKDNIWHTPVTLAMGTFDETK